MSYQETQALIEQGWTNPSETPNPLKNAVDHALEALGEGRLRVAEKKDGVWQVHAWIKKAILLAFRLYPTRFSDTPFLAYDKFPLKFQGWSEETFAQAQIRALPGSLVRASAYIGPKVVLMPSFVNVGAYVDEGTMVDTWATIGSCAQIGKNCHISGGTGIGGVLEPLQANPVIIEDDCFIGARSEIVEGVRVEKGSVIGMGVFIGQSTPLVTRETGEISFGVIPPYSVVIAGSLPSKTKGPGLENLHLPCAVIVKTVDERTRQKTAVNELLRV